MRTGNLYVDDESLAPWSLRIIAGIKEKEGIAQETHQKSIL
jgi:hypothetical protein